MFYSNQEMNSCQPKFWRSKQLLMKYYFTKIILLLLTISGGLLAQDGQIAVDLLQAKYADFSLEATDVRELRVSDDYTSGGLRHIYVAQYYEGVPVFNALAILHYRGNQLLHSTTGRLVAGLADAAPVSAPGLRAQQAVRQAMAEVTATFDTPVAVGMDGATYLFRASSVSPEAIRARLVYFPQGQGELRLAWDVMVDQQGTHSDYWSIMVDAESGEILEKYNHVLKCNFGSRPHKHNYGNACADMAPKRVFEEVLSAGVTDGARYNVFPFGVESPLHGERTIVVEPADSIASPFGWHDTDGEAGPEFTITRGNNVYAYPDRDDVENSPDPGEEADGGAALNFDFFYADEQQPDSILEAALTQVFYTSNRVHDWLHYAGFDEASGNFQQTNYTGDGAGRDAIRAEAQDGSGTNNANFATPADGSAPRMQMFLWENAAASAMAVTTPAGIAGPYNTGTANFGALIGNEPTVGDVVLADPLLACEPVATNVSGKIALIRRGTCEFGSKILAAQNAGAIGAIICNDAAEGQARGGIINMAPGEDGGSVVIPSVFLSLEGCAPLFAAVQAGDSVSITFQATTPPPVDGDFDSGIVAHEIGHGVSTRLVGGPSNSDCLRNDEQMGEGWSDFFTLASTPQTLTDTPDGTEGRGIGNFATNRGVDGIGIRRKQYSTDMAVNNFTYDNIISSGVPHPLGEIWATTLWDLYWAMVEEYGFDEDLITGTGGNNLAVQLVVEGFKFTDCGPGLLDGRDGILAADEFINGGANQCLIWEVFARRGMGFSAEGGSPNDRTDGREAFDVSPFCVGGIQAVKEVNKPIVIAGEEITYTIRVTNYDTLTAKNVIVTEEIPAGLTIDEASIAGADFTISGNVITFNLGSIDFDDSETIRYTAVTDATTATEASFFDGAEDGDDNWEVINLAGDFLWEQADTTPFAGELGWYIVNVGSAQDQTLQTFEALPVIGERPALRFWTKYDTEARWDAGIVEVSRDGTNWETVEDKFLRGGYRGRIDENGSEQLQGTTAFWGNNERFEEMIIDLSEFAGQEIFFRFRFVSDDAESGRAWWVDNIEIVDVVNYDGVTTVTAEGLPTFTTQAGDLGALAVDAQVISDTEDPTLGQTRVEVFPNPASELVNVKITSERTGAATLQLVGVDGRILRTEVINLRPGGATATVNTSTLPAGMYFVQVTGASQISTTKLTVN